MSFLKKLFGGDRQEDQQVQQAQQEELAQGPDNSEQLQQAGLDQEEEQGNWLSRAWGGLKDSGSHIGRSVGNGGKIGAGIGAVPTGLIGAGIGAGVGRATGKENTGTGAKVGGAILGAPGALIGGLLGGLTGLGAAIKDEITYDEEKLLAETANIPAYHIIVEQLAHSFAYGRGDMAQLEAWGYELSAEHEDSNSGFRVVGFKPKAQGALDPDGNPLKPVVAFRGTANAGGALDDINDQGVGTFQFSRNEKEIHNVIASARAGSAPDVTGHSLGGALAQLAAARLGSQVGNIITFQAAGINGAEAQRIDSEAHQATHYRAGGDLVHSGGEAFANGEVIQFNTKGLDTALSHMTFPLAELNALRGKKDTDVPHVEGIDRVKESHLHSVDRYEDSNNAEQSGIVEAIGGGRNAGKVMGAIASTGVSDRQQQYAKAWRQIRAVAMTVRIEADIPGTRERIVSLCIDLGVQPRDHGKFISQAEAAMLDSLELAKMQQMEGGYA